ncbi:hypothetical protein T484DRAFT_1821969, partial [Baffinella frigidus]
MPEPGTEALIERILGLVVEGCQVSAIVPGGPLDKDVRGVTVQPGAWLEPGDNVVMVDQKSVDSETLPLALRGDDQIGSAVVLTLRKKTTGKHVEIVANRGSI